MPLSCSRSLKGWLGLLLLASGGPGCSAFTADEPPVADSTMIQVLIEFHLAAARSSLQHDLSPAVRDSIFDRYGIDSVAFRETISYYAEHPDAYADLYTAVLDRLSAERVRQGDLSSPGLLPSETPVLPKE